MPHTGLFVFSAQVHDSGSSRLKFYRMSIHFLLQLLCYVALLMSAWLWISSFNDTNQRLLLQYVDARNILTTVKVRLELPHDSWLDELRSSLPQPPIPNSAAPCHIVALAKVKPGREFSHAHPA